jgi:tripartite-type tricarboxylate transporter receptor subunit TctC
MRTNLCPTMIVIALLVAFAERAAAQGSDYPSHAVTFIVPFTPGGGNDIMARLVGQKLEQKFGKPFVIENRPGGGGLPAAMDVVRGPADGYTLIAASSTMMALNVTVRKTMPYDPRTDLTPLALIARIPFVLVVNPALPVHSVDDLAKLAREKPLSFGAPGPANFHRLNAELFKTIFGVEATYVPYKGTVPALNDIIGGHIQFMFADLPPALPLIRAGKLRALGVTTKERVPALSEVPPLAQAGMPGFDSASWHTVATNANVPKGIVDKLSAAIREAMNDKAVVDLLNHEGAIPLVPSPSPDEVKRFIASEIVRWGAVIEKAGIAHSE